MAFCNRADTGATPAAAATASQTAASGPAGPNTPPPPPTHTLDGTTLNGAAPTGWRAALEPFINRAVPANLRAVLGAAGMQGMPSPNFNAHGPATDMSSTYPVTATPNRPTTATGMLAPGNTPPMMQDPGESKYSKGGGKLGNL